MRNALPTVRQIAAADLAYHSSVISIEEAVHKMLNNGRPARASYYAESADGRFRFIAWGPPPSTGDRLCLGVTGRTEDQLIRDILNGRYDHVLGRRQGESY